MSFGGANKGSSHQYNNFSRGPGNSFGSGPGQTHHQVEIYGWKNGSPGDCVSFIKRKCHISVTNYSVDHATGALVGSVASERDASQLVGWSGVKYAGLSLKITSITPANGNGAKPLETLKAFLKTRYNPEVKLLNLSAVHLDQGLIAEGFFANPGTSSKFFPALIRVAETLKIEVTSADLSNNNLAELSSVSTLAHTFPTLKNLSLQNNKIGRVRAFDVWKKNFNHLRELILQGNPLLNTTNPTEIVNIKVDLMKAFPRLIVLNGEVVRNEAALNQLLRFPFGQPQPMFFSDTDVQGISTNFISNFIKMWDDDRAGLMVLYQNESQFSLQVDSTSSHTNDPKGVADFGYYIPSSRNLTKVSSAKARMSKVCTGQEQVYKSFQQIPKTRHDLLSKPELFSMEAFKIAQLGAISITLHGSFEETAPPQDTSHMNLSSGGGRGKYHYNKKTKCTLGRKSFDRSIVVIPGPNNSMIIASDLLCVRNEADADAFTPSTPTNVVPASVPPMAHTPTPSPGPVANAPPQQMGAPVPIIAPGVPSTADLPQELKTSLSPPQQELLVKVLIETKLNIQYGFMLCQQSNWDYQQCGTNFKNSAPSLPPDAFA